MENTISLEQRFLTNRATKEEHFFSTFQEVQEFLEKRNAFPNYKEKYDDNVRLLYTIDKCLIDNETGEEIDFRELTEGNEHIDYVLVQHKETTEQERFTTYKQFQEAKGESVSDFHIFYAKILPCQITILEHIQTSIFLCYDSIVDAITFLTDNLSSVNEYKLHTSQANLDLYNEAFILHSRKHKLEILEKNYKQTRQIHIQNGHNFTIDFATDNGKYFLKIIETVKAEVQDFNEKNTTFKVHEFFITIEAEGGKRQIQIRMINWLWKYIFEEVLQYTQKQKQTFEKMQLEIQQVTDIEKIQALPVDFHNINGLSINVNETLEHLIKVAHGQNSILKKTIKETYIDNKGKETQLRMPETVIDLLMVVAKSPDMLFQETNIDIIKEDNRNILQNSFFK